MKPKDGGPAFPVGFKEFDQTVHGKAPYVGMPGMSLRQYYVGQALPAVIAGYTSLAEKGIGDDGTAASACAKDSIAFADAVLAELSKETT